MGRTGRFRLAFLAFAVLALAAAAAWAAVPNRNEPSCAAAGPWLDARCYGARGDGSGDDSAALEKAVRAAIVADTPLLLPHGTYRLSHPLVIDYREVSDTGFRLISMGAVLDG